MEKTESRKTRSQSSSARSQFNKRKPKRKVSDTGRTQRNRLHHRVSLAKSVGKIRKGEEETPIVALQQVHLYRKQKAFLSKQAIVFEKRAVAIKEQIKSIDEKIRTQKKIAVELINAIEKENEDIEEILDSSTHRSRPDNTMSQKTKKFFRLGY
jgi:hypothetical protein